MKPTETAQAAPAPTPAPTPAAGASIESSVIYDTNGVKITAKSLGYDGIFGPELYVLIENATDKNLTVQAENASVNGFMVETIFSSDVPAGKKANDSITFQEQSLERAGIDKIAVIEFGIVVFDSDTWDDRTASEPIIIQTSIAGSYTQEADDSGTVAVDQNGVRIIAKGIDDEGLMGPELILYIENNTDENITVQARNVSVNGFVVDPIFSSDIMSGKKIIDSLTIMSSDMDENNIESIENIECYFTVIDMDSWDSIFDSEIVSLEFTQ